MKEIWKEIRLIITLRLLSIIITICPDIREKILLVNGINDFVSYHLGNDTRSTLSDSMLGDYQSVPDSNELYDVGMKPWPLYKLPGE
jgi:hypothetical protein